MGRPFGVIYGLFLLGPFRFFSGATALRFFIGKKMNLGKSHAKYNLLTQNVIFRFTGHKKRYFLGPRNPGSMSIEPPTIEPQANLTPTIKSGDN